jgi:hypothetical protein
LDSSEEKDKEVSPPPTRVPITTPLQRPVSSSSSTSHNDLVSSSSGNDNHQYFRVFNTHLRPHQLPPNAKCLYVMRHPFDVLASFYYHLANMDVTDGGYTGTPTEFCQDFVQGTVLYGKWQDHLEAWLSSDKVVGQTQSSKPKDSGNDDVDEIHGSVLLLHYDEMKNDLKGQATRVAKFLGVPTDQIETVVNEAIEHCTFDAMKQERWRYTPRSVVWKKDDETGQPYQHFVRAGRTGDGTSFLETHGTKDIYQRWQTDKATARERWRIAGIDQTIIHRYLPTESK